MRNIHFANVSTSEYYPESTPGTVSMAFALATRVNSSHPVHHPGPEYYPGPCFTIPQVIRHRRPNSTTPRSIIPTESATPIELFTSKGILRPSSSPVLFSPHSGQPRPVLPDRDRARSTTGTKDTRENSHAASRRCAPSPFPVPHSLYFCFHFTSDEQPPIFA